MVKYLVIIIHILFHKIDKCVIITLGDNMKLVVINNIKYNLITNYKDGFDQEEIEKRITDYFNDYDYILGDWAYGKLRLKGFCKRENKLFNEINDFEKRKDYLRNNCAFDCRYFILEKE